MNTKNQGGGSFNKVPIPPPNKKNLIIFKNKKREKVGLSLSLSTRSKQIFIPTSSRLTSEPKPCVKKYNKMIGNFKIIC